MLNERLVEKYLIDHKLKEAQFCKDGVHYLASLQTDPGNQFTDSRDFVYIKKIPSPINLDSYKEVKGGFYDCKFGTITILTIDDKLSEVSFGKNLDLQWSTLDRPSLKDVDPVDSKIVQAVIRNINTGEPYPYELNLNGTDFQKSVWASIQTIPRGSTISYSELAAKTNNPKAIRAAATACGKNPIMIIVPCHRVISNDGSIGNYAFGSVLKKSILMDEGAIK